jgi:hypothetical protein
VNPLVRGAAGRLGIVGIGFVAFRIRCHDHLLQSVTTGWMMNRERDPLRLRGASRDVSRPLRIGCSHPDLPRYSWFEFGFDGAVERLVLRYR